MVVDLEERPSPIRENKNNYHSSDNESNHERNKVQSNPNCETEDQEAGLNTILEDSNLDQTVSPDKIQDSPKKEPKPTQVTEFQQQT